MSQQRLPGRERVIVAERLNAAVGDPERALAFDPTIGPCFRQVCAERAALAAEPCADADLAIAEPVRPLRQRNQHAPQATLPDRLVTGAGRYSRYGTRCRGSCCARRRRWRSRWPPLRPF